MQRKIFAITGSTRPDSSNTRLLQFVSGLTRDKLSFTIYEDIGSLPHFHPDQSIEDPPEVIVQLRRQIEEADGVMICTPEYVFSIPGSLKNALEWCVATVVLSDKPTALITASAHGQKGHEELQLIMRTLGANFTEDTALLIQGFRGKMDAGGQITDTDTRKALVTLTDSFTELVFSSH